MNVYIIAAQKRNSDRLLPQTTAWERDYSVDLIFHVGIQFLFFIAEVDVSDASVPKTEANVEQGETWLFYSLSFVW